MIYTFIKNWYLKSRIQQTEMEQESVPTSPPVPQEVREFIRIIKKDPTLIDCGYVEICQLEFSLDGCMDYSSITIRDTSNLKTYYKAYNGARNGWKWEVQLWTTDENNQRKICAILNKYIKKIS